jgi:superfamily I DNA/RNA helicase
MSGPGSVPKPTLQVSDEAYRIFPGPLLLLAGPGTGKTFQLARRLQFLTVELSASPEQLTVITFTQEAAQSMRRKLSERGKPEFMPKDKRPGIIRTMHSLGHAIIEENLSAVGLAANFKVVEEEELRKTLFVDAALRVGDCESDGVNALIDRIKGKRRLSDKSRRISTEYQRLLRACNCIDFDDQIIVASDLIKNDAQIRAKWQTRAQHLLVDEYQDINQAQFEFISQLSEASSEGLFVVGDDDQSIYQFRGGSPEFIRHFAAHFGPEAKVIQMKTSRRCKRNILTAANALIEKHDRERMPKTASDFTMTEVGEVFVHGCPSDDREAEIISTIIKSAIDGTEKERQSAFILIPNRLYSKKIEMALSSFGIDYSVKLGESKAFSKFILMRDWAEATADNLLTRRAMQTVIESGQCRVPSAKKKAQANVNLRSATLKIIAGLWDRVVSGESNLITALEQVCDGNLECKDLLEKMVLIQKAHREDFAEFLRLGATYLKPWSGVSAFFEELEGIERFKRRPAQLGNFQTRIMSMQASKGLEANHVFVVGLEEGNIPDDDSESPLAEQARLVFVAMTRAKDTLHLFHARKRTSRISFRKVSHQLSESRFLVGLPVPRDKRIYHPSKNSARSPKSSK